MENTAAKKLKQVPEGYLIIGIDPHKKRHAAGAITQDFTIPVPYVNSPCMALAPLLYSSLDSPTYEPFSFSLPRVYDKAREPLPRKGWIK